MYFALSQSERPDLGNVCAHKDKNPHAGGRRLTALCLSHLPLSIATDKKKKKSSHTFTKMTSQEKRQNKDSLWQSHVLEVRGGSTETKRKMKSFAFPKQLTLKSNEITFGELMLWVHAG